jgi:hypothetical protein
LCLKKEVFIYLKIHLFILKIKKVKMKNKLLFSLISISLILVISGFVSAACLGTYSWEKATDSICSSESGTSFQCDYLQDNVWPGSLPCQPNTGCWSTVSMGGGLDPWSSQYATSDLGEKKCITSIRVKNSETFLQRADIRVSDDNFIYSTAISDWEIEPHQGDLGLWRTIPIAEQTRYVQLYFPDAADCEGGPGQWWCGLSEIEIYAADYCEARSEADICTNPMICTVEDNCGTPVNCGDYNTRPELCTNECGNVDFGCGNVNCGGCDDGDSCTQDNCVLNSCEYPIEPACTCGGDSDQIIMKLFRSENSHGAFWNDPNYEIEVCYEDIFGSEFEGVEPHECTYAHDALPGDEPENVIVRLYQETNSHAELPDLVSPTPEYDKFVCFGNLECLPRSTVECAAMEGGSGEWKEVVRLEQSTNSHISIAGDPDYVQRVCCKSQSSSIDSVKWTDLNGVTLTSGADVGLKSKVYAEVDGIFLGGKTIRYEIYKGANPDPSVDDPEIVYTDDFKLRWNAGKISSSPEIFEGGTYRFRSRIEPSGTWTGLSTPIEVSNEERNIPPTVIINGILDKQIYFLNEELHLSATITDPDDELFEYEWNLGDGTILTGNSVHLENYEFDYSFTGPDGKGQKNIVLTARDQRGAMGFDKKSIVIVNSSYALAYIDTPVFEEVILDRQVDFDASSSYVVSTSDSDFDGCTDTVICEAGKCPSQTAGCPPCGPSPPGCEITISPITINYDAINFIWDIDNGYDLQEGLGLVSVLDYNFPIIGMHTALLEIQFGTGIDETSAFTETQFDILFGLDNICFEARTEADIIFVGGGTIGDTFWIDPSTGEKVSSMNNCNRPLGVDLNGDLMPNCCPSGYACESDKCVPSDINFCEDYKTQSDCDGQDAYDELDDSLEGLDCDYLGSYGDDCSKFMSCKCFWNSGTGKCEAKAKEKIRMLNPNYEVFETTAAADPFCPAHPATTLDACSFAFTYTGDCSDGDEYIRRDWTATGTLSFCQNGNDIIACAQLVRLDFFNWINLVITILALIGIYGFYFNKKTKER